MAKQKTIFDVAASVTSSVYKTAQKKNAARKRQEERERLVEMEYQAKADAIKAKSAAKASVLKAEALAKAEAKELMLKSEAQAREEAKTAEMISNIYNISFSIDNVNGIITELFNLQPIIESLVNREEFENPLCKTAIAKFKSGLTMLKVADPANAGISIFDETINSYNKEFETTTQKRAEAAKMEEQNRKAQKMLSKKLENMSKDNLKETIEEFVESNIQDREILLDAVRTLASLYLTDSSIACIKSNYETIFKKCEAILADDAEFIAFKENEGAKVAAKIKKDNIIVLAVCICLCLPSVIYITIKALIS